MNGLPASSLGIDLRHLRYFLAVYEELHFGRAAGRLSIAQPPLSQAIRKLEAEIGVPLLERTSRSVRPTDAGDVLASEARKVLATFAFAIGETRRAAHPDLTIRIGCGICIPDHELHRFICALKDRAERVQVEVVHLLGPEQVARLRAGELDLGVLPHVEEYDDLEWELLLPGEQLSAFLPSTYPLASKSAVTPDDVRSETVLMSSGNPAFMDKLMGGLTSAGFRFAEIHECNPDPRDYFLAVAGGVGVAVGPAPFLEIARFVSPELVAVPLDPPVTYPDTIVVWRANPPRIVAPLLESVRGAAAELFRGSAGTGARTAA